MQAGKLYRRVMTETDQDHLIGNIEAHLGGAQKRIQVRQAAEVEKLAAMSQEERSRATSG